MRERSISQIGGRAQEERTTALDPRGAGAVPSAMSE
jgi:hypothetical protein